MKMLILRVVLASREDGLQHLFETNTLSEFGV